MKEVKEKRHDGGKENKRGNEGHGANAPSFKATLYVYQSDVCRNNDFKGYVSHNASFNKTHRLWKTHTSKKQTNKDFEVRCVNTWKVIMQLSDKPTSYSMLHLCKSIL